MSRSFIASFLLAAVLLVAGSASAAGFAQIGYFIFSWEGVYTGARNTALGGADLAGIDASDAILVNPAPLAEGNRISGSFGKFEQYPLSTDLEAWAVAASWNRWRLSACQSGWEYGFVGGRTAYNPEGTGEIAERKDSMRLLGLSYEFVDTQAQGGSWRLAVGGAYRIYRTALEDSVLGYELEGGTFDLGATTSWMHRFDTGRFELRGAVVGQNITDQKIDDEGREIPMPRTVSGGLSARTTLDWPGRQRDALSVLLAYNHVHRPDYPDDSDHVGLELVGGGALALRYGSNDAKFGGIKGWGLGLILAEPFMGPLSLRADWAKLDTANGYPDGLEVWGLEAAFAF